MKYPVGKLLLLLLTLAPAAAPAAETIPVQTLDGTEVRVFSAVPAPGVHPSILISPEEIAAIAALAAGKTPAPSAP